MYISRLYYDVSVRLSGPSVCDGSALEHYS